MVIRELVAKAHQMDASDLLLETETPAVVRVRGELQTIGEKLPAADLDRAGKELLSDEGWALFLKRGSADLSINLAGTQCRINIFRSVRGLGIAVRLLSASVNGLRACNLHPDLMALANARSGLVIVSGPTGCGKSTTLAALLEEINLARASNIITLESPVEYMYSNRLSFIRQREIPSHSPSYEQAIIDAMRENPDVLVIGEMRTPEVMRLTLNAAETGHLVLTTMHSANCAEALSRICMSFAPEIHGSILAQIADCLVGVVCQRFDFLSQYQLRVPRCEILTGSSGAKGAIRAGQFSQIATVLQTGADHGMWTFERYQQWMAHKKDWVLPPAAGGAENPGSVIPAH